ncbi:MAG: dihydroorotate dehydrogenase-like protein [Candidatus Rifleibacteriota bacterium]
MADLKTRFFGLDLKNPLIAASSSLTATPDNIAKFSECGVGAIVLKSVFEEEVLNEYDQIAQDYSSSHFEEFIDYFDYKIRNNVLGNYGKFIREAKKNSEVPVVASINCISAGNWLQFASQVQDAGADAIELNLLVLPSDVSRSAEDNHRFYLEAVKEVRNKVNIPLSIKISNYFSDLARFCKEIDELKVDGITLFNRFATPDIDIKKEKLIEASPLSSEVEHLMSLRWIGLLSSRLDCPLAASGGVHTWEQMIKMILAGAGAVQMATAFYQKNIEYALEVVKGLETWMNNKGYEKIDDFRGNLAGDKTANPGFYERAQFLSSFGDFEKK